MPIILTGKPSSTVRSAPQGCLRVAPLDANDRPGPWRDVGGVEVFDLSSDPTFTEAYTTCGEIRERDLYIPFENNTELSLTLTHILDARNTALGMSGILTEIDAVPVTTLADGVIAVPNPSYVGSDLDDTTFFGRYYQIFRDTSGTGGTPRVHAFSDTVSMDYDEDGIGGTAAVPTWAPSKELSNVTAADFAIEPPAGTENTGEGGGTAYTVATGDIEINEAMGQIFIVYKTTAGSLYNKILAIGAANTSDTHVLLRLTCSTTTASALFTANSKQAVVDALTKTSTLYAAQIYMQDRVRGGYRSRLDIWKTRFIANGARSFISTDADPSTLEFTAALEKPSWLTEDAQDRGLYRWKELRV